MAPALAVEIDTVACVIGPAGAGCELEPDGGVVDAGLLDPLHPGRSEETERAAVPWRTLRRVSTDGTASGFIEEGSATLY